MVKDRDVELWICGSGDSKEAINEATRIDSRIKFFGLVDSETALEMQHKATILVNPRTSEGEYTKYSFPSKQWNICLREEVSLLIICQESLKSIMIMSIPQKTKVWRPWQNVFQV